MGLRSGTPVYFIKREGARKNEEKKALNDKIEKQNCV